MARRQIGYCPQFDTIFEGLTVLEHLQIYGAIKGIKKSLLPRICDKAIKDMDLGDYVHIRANNLSGGNKRKMAVALALLGNPPLVFLDEPSTGVDPQAKRFMWNIVSKISTQKGKSAVIITTHSMEEAEALCTKMGIMVDGQFKCFGSSQHIKDKYGTGYELEIKIRTLTEQESDEYARVKNLPQKLDRAACEWILNENGWSFLIEEIKENGQGEEFHRLFKEGQKVDTNEFLRWQFAEGQGNKAVDYLETLFREFIVLEHYGNSFKLKVSRDNYSIGFLFGLMEDIQ
jgi:ATP-binding cassette, subfamily A (ABC1), member 3